MGKCSPKRDVSSITLKTLQILVLNNINKDKVSENPSLLKKSNFMEALFQAYDNATQYRGLKIEILMETG